MSSGLSQNNIYSLLIDETGYVWAGTLDGLNRYNGYSFESIGANESKAGTLNGSIIAALCKGHNNDIWIVSRNGGLNKFDANHHTIHSYPDSLFPNFNPRGITEMCVSGPWLWMRNQGHIACYHMQSQKFYVSFQGNNINGIRCYSDSSILVYGTQGIAEAWIGDQVVKTQTKWKSSTFIMSESKDLLGLTSGGLIRWGPQFNHNDTLLTHNELSKSGYSFRHSSSMVLIDDVVWFGGSFPLIRVKLGTKQPTFERFFYQADNQFSFFGNYVSTLKTDKAGNLWIGTDKHGLNLFDRSRNLFKHYTPSLLHTSKQNIDPVRAICTTDAGDLWMGFDKDGVGIQQADGNHRYYDHFYNAEGRAIELKGVRNIFEDSQGTIWLCEISNLCYFNAQKDRIETVDCKYNWTWPYRSYVVKEFEQGLLTITGGINLGIVNLNTGNLTMLPTSKNGIGIKAVVRDMIYDRYQNLYLAMDNASILKIDYPTLNYSYINPSKSGISDTKVYAFATRNDSLWIATNTGLNLYDIKQKKVISRYYESDGLSNNVIYSVYLKGKELWMSTNRGISKLDLHTNKIDVFLGSDFFMDDARHQSRTGEIFYGGYSGIVSFHPKELANKVESKTPVIESLFLLNTEILPGDSINGEVLYSATLKQNDLLQLHHYQNTFSLRFNAFPFSYPSNHVFRYRLSGLHNDWIYPNTGIREASYTKIFPGKYVFEVEVKMGSKVWSDPFRLRIDVIPPIWQRNWFKLLVAILLMLLFTLAYRYRMYQIKQRNELLKQKVNEQTAELKLQNQQIKEISDKLHEADQSRLRFFTNISHEFRTPLTLILGQLEMMKSVAETKALKGVQKSAFHLLRLVNQLIDFRKMELGQTRLCVESFDLVPFTAEIVDSFQVLATKNNIDLRFISVVKSCKIWLDKEKTEKILFNLISNALKYTPAGQSVTVELNTRSKISTIRISDTGIGISASELKHIFDRFFRSNEMSKSEAGHGIGLTLVKGLTEFQQGHISVESEVNKGTSFQLTFKNGKDHFAQKDFGKAQTQAYLLNESSEPVSQDLLSAGADILVLEDNTDLLKFMCDLLSPQFNIKTAKNGLEGLEILKTYRPDLIISDIMMPLMDGMEFCRKVKSHMETCHIPFILLTAKTDLEAHIEGFELGIDHYIEKPFSPALLLAKIASLLKNRAQARKQLLNGTLNTNATTASISKRDKQFWDKVCIHVAEGFASPSFNSEQLAHELGMSRASLNRKFKALAGASPGDFIRKRRLNAACERLHNTQLHVNQISDEVGFQSVSHFRKAFKDAYGKTPSDYRKG